MCIYDEQLWDIVQVKEEEDYSVVSYLLKKGWKLLKVLKNLESEFGETCIYSIGRPSDVPPEYPEDDNQAQ
ncbi:hypothetical protein ACEXAJ_11570 [Fusobacterium necrophorum subsp. funduliforme]